MKEITQIYQAINAVSERVNTLASQVNDLAISLNNMRAADIDYIAMETGIDLDQEEEINNE